uniref:Uncharacterized protein n=1 Tax=Arundo donax TaxID=35708 RepID=A0A0A9EKZ3_ARUDO
MLETTFLSFGCNVVAVTYLLVTI